MKALTGINIRISHISYTLIFTAFVYIIYNAINIDKIVKWFPMGGSIDYGGLAAYLMVGFCLFVAFFILFAHRWTIKPASVLVIISSATVTYFISKYNVAIDRTMVMNSLHTDYTEVTGLLSKQMIPYIFFLIIIPVFVVLNIEITFSSVRRYLFSSILIFVLAISSGVGFVYLKYSSIHMAANVSDKYIIHSLVPINYINSIGSALHRTVQAYYGKNKKEIVITGSVASVDDLVVVLVVGEASRQKNFSLYGYKSRNTNPVLSNVSDLHLLNGKARIGSTLYALPEILEKNDVKLPAVTSKLGIDTSCYVNFTLYDNCSSVGEVPVSNCGHGGACYDEDVIPLLRKNLKLYQSGYRFIVLHLGGGSHGPTYKDRYPPEFQQFNPQCQDPDVLNKCTVDELYNSYDNTILYVDHVLGKIISELDRSKVPYVFIYISDHGESLRENDLIFHGMPPGIPLPPEQAQVPLIVKSSVPVSIENRSEYKQQDIFDTVLDLFSIETELVGKEGSFIKKKI